MFNIEEERLEELANEYEVSINLVRSYAEMMSNCSMTTDDETYDRMLESAVSMLNPIVIENMKDKIQRRSREDILAKTLKITFNDYDDEAIKAEVESMISSMEEKRR